MYIGSKKTPLCYRIKEQPRVRFSRTLAEVSDKECPKVRFGRVSDNAKVRSITNHSNEGWNAYPTTNRDFSTPRWSLVLAGCGWVSDTYVE